MVVRVTLFALFLPLAAQSAELYKLDPGPLSLSERKTLRLHDKARDKDLPVRVSYPREPGKYPLIIFSHGMFGSKDGLQPVVEHWVRHGYVVIRPTHGDSISLMTPEQRRALGGLRGLREQTGNPKLTQYWDDRVQDVKFVLDSLDTIEQQSPGLKGKLDRDRIAHSGHSFGAHTSMLLSGLTLYGPRGDQIKMADERLKCAVFISPQGTGKSITPQSYQSIRIPVLMITGSKDESPRTGQGAKWRLEAWEHMPNKDKYLLFIEGAHHGFGGIVGRQRYPGSGPPNKAHVNFVKTTTLSFWDAYLKKDPVAKAALHATTIKERSNGEARLSHK